MRTPDKRHLAQYAYALRLIFVLILGFVGHQPVGYGYESHSAQAAEKTQSLIHYTNQKGLSGILESGNIRPSLKAINPNDVRYGNGQYLSDIIPGTKTPAQLSREFLGQPFQGSKYTHYIEIDVSGLNGSQPKGSVSAEGVRPIIAILQINVCVVL